MKTIITGVTGMVGEGVLHECIRHESVEEILIIGRRPCGISHPKIKEIVLQNLGDLSPIQEQLVGYDGCLFCLGTTSVGKSEKDYYHTTYTLTLNFAKTLSKYNPEATFCYISGAGTDSTEKGGSVWARVKGKTENDLMKLPFKQVYAFRPGFIRPTPGLKNTLSFYKYINWMYPFLRTVFPNSVSTMTELGLAMIYAVLKGYDKQILEVKDIVALSKY
jgi:uncharacterized protein YbjT (DUF2867 family)